MFVKEYLFTYNSALRGFEEATDVVAKGTDLVLTGGKQIIRK